MARRTVSRFLRGAANWGTAAAPLGPKVAVPVAIGGGILEAVTGKGQQKFNREPYDKAFDNYMRGARRDTRRMSRELGSQRGARLAARGVNESAVGDFLHGANTAKLYQGTQRQINDARANLESQIAHAEDMMERGASVMETNRWAQTRNMLIEKLDTQANPEDEGGSIKREELVSLMKRRGLDDATINNYLKNLGLVETGTEAQTTTETTTEATSNVGRSGYEYVSPDGQQSAKNPYGKMKPLFESGGQDSSRGSFPMMPKSKAAPKQPSPISMKAIEEIGDFIASYLTETLGEDFSDIFDYEA